jgi:hypothetical protein
MIKRYGYNEHMADRAITQEYPVNHKETAEKIRENCKSAMTITSSKITQIRVYIVEKMEKTLALRIEH